MPGNLRPLVTFKVRTKGPPGAEIEDLACDSKSKDSWHAR